MPESYDEAMRTNERKKWRKACEAEHEAMINNMVYD